MRSELKRVLHIDDDEQLDFHFRSEAFWNEAKIFFGSLTENQQSSVLNGGSASVSWSALSPNIQRLYHQNWDISWDDARKEDASIQPPPRPADPERLTFRRAGTDLRQDFFSPRIDIVLPDNAESWLGTGHIEVGIRDALKAAWMLPGDTLLSSRRNAVITEPKETEESRTELQKLQEDADTIRRLFPQRPGHLPQPHGIPLKLALSQLAEGASVPVFALVPAKFEQNFYSPIGKRVLEFIDPMEHHGRRYFCKWRNDVLLLIAPGWFAEATDPVPFHLLRGLQADASGYVPILDLARFYSRLSEDQARWFGEEYGVEDSNRLRACLTVVARYPGSLRPGGVGLDADTLEPLSRAVNSRESGIDKTVYRFARLKPRSVVNPVAHTTTLLLDIELFETARGRWLPVTSIPYPRLSRLFNKL